MWPGEWPDPPSFSLSPGRAHLPFRELDKPFEVQDRAADALSEEDPVDSDIRDTQALK